MHKVPWIIKLIESNNCLTLCSNIVIHSEKSDQSTIGKICKYFINVLPLNRRVGTRMSYLSSTRKNVPSRLKIHEQSAGDGTFLRAESRLNVHTRRAEIGRYYTRSRGRTYLLRPDEILFSLTKHV